MDRRLGKKENHPITTSYLVVCPYFYKLGIKQKDCPLNQQNVPDRRLSNDRRKTQTGEKDRRWIKAEMCRLFQTKECSYKKYPHLRHMPELLPCLCNSKAIVGLVEEY